MSPFIERCRELLATGASVDDVLGVLRREGESRMASIKLLRELTGMSLRDAKSAVHMSPVWEDLRQEADTFHEQLEQTAEQLRKPEPPTD